ncbi:tRNA(His) guanylyltransferase Thg1 family protein [Micromonospora sp. NPDC005806]|uniref:tRNA(His) guanylyltransferase Thg1 family protein n=1 Tax=Micromonospora sp. NPDC005806 TaxID=3364234 RepID=UPI0036C7F126
MVHAEEFEARQRARESFHSLRVLPGAWTVIRVDGRGFSRLTEQRFDKPFDARFCDLMVVTAQTLLTELGARYAYTASDEISILLDPASDLFGRGVEKLVSISAGIAAAAFTQAAAEAAHFDSRLWVGVGVEDVADYFSWRQSDATRSALNGWCYWALRKTGQSPRQASHTMQGVGTADKTTLLLRHGITFDDLPSWQRRGVGLWRETAEHPGFDPVRGTPVVTTRRRTRTERELPEKDAYRQLVTALATGQR